MLGIKELKKEISEAVRTGIVSTAEAKAIEYQDMIGNSTFEELAELANAENGEARRTFYQIYSEAYGPIEAIKFYLNNSDNLSKKIFEQCEAAAQEAETRTKNLLQPKIDEQKKTIGSQVNTIMTLTEKVARMQEENDELNEIIKKQQNEIINLKARLFDLLDNK